MGVLLLAVVAFIASWAVAYLPRRDVDFYSVDGVFHETAATAIRRDRSTRSLSEVYLLDGHAGSQNENPLLLAVLLAYLPCPVRLWLHRHGSGFLLGLLAFLPAIGAATEGRIGSGVAAILVILSTPILLRESIGFNARLPGVVAVTGFWMIYLYLRNIPDVAMAVTLSAVVTSIALLHRLSLQAVAFSALLLTVAEGDWLPLVGLLGGWLAAFAVAPSHYRTVFAGHRRLLRLHRRTPDLNESAVRDYVGRAVSIQRPPWWRVVRLIGAGGATLLLTPWLIVTAERSVAMEVAVGLSVLATMVSLVAPLRFLGEGERYFEFAAVAAAEAVATRLPDARLFTLIAIGAALGVVQYRKLWRTARDELTPALRAPLRAALLRARGEPETRLLSLPMWTARFAAYVARKQVYDAAAHRTWTISPHYAPVLTAPVRRAVKELKLEAALVDTRVPVAQLGEIDEIAELRWELGPYRYYRFDDLQE